MTTAITSDRVGRIEAFTYAWLGSANGSPSIELLNGVEQRRNLQGDPAPLSTLGAYSGTANGQTATAKLENLVSAVFPSGRSWRMTWSIGPTDGWNASKGFAGVTAGKTYTFSMYMRGSYAGAARVTMEFQNSAGQNLDGYNSGPAVAFSPVDPRRIFVTRTAPPGAVKGTVFFDNGGELKPSAGDWVEASSAMIEEGATATSYFSGDTPARTERYYDGSMPTVALGYSASKASQNIVHKVIGGGEDVSLIAAGPRSGTFRLLYDTAEAAFECVRIHQYATQLYLVDSDLPASAAIQYYVDGRVTLEQDDDRAVWLVSIDFREVTF